eukprot:4994958-Amphidinium_carterae.1
MPVTGLTPRLDSPHRTALEHPSTMPSDPVGFRWASTSNLGGLGQAAHLGVGATNLPGSGCSDLHAHTPA